METIRKTVLQVTVLHPVTEATTLWGISLEQIGYQIDEGTWLGQVTTISAEDVPADKITEECKALGNDGEFFDNPFDEGKRIMAEFIPQAWVNDCSIEVDAEGETEWDVTDEILAFGKEKALEITDDDYESDNLRDSKNAPQWVRDWSGPFRINVEDSIREYFEDDESTA